MPSREPELYKDKIEVSLDGRQIFYLFFGGAVIVGLVFVLGVLVGRRVEARGHLDRAEASAASDPLAALDRLERSDNLSFRGALSGNQAPTEVEKAIGELEKRRAAGKAEEAKPTPAKAAEAKPVEAKPVEAKPVEAKPAEAKAAEAKPAEAKAAEVKPDAEPVTHPDPDKPRTDKRDDKKPKKHGDGKTSTGDSRADAAGDAVKVDSDAKTRFTLQLSSFQDRSEAEAFLASIKSAGFQPYLTEADVTGKGTFYRVRLGSYRSLEAANDAKSEFEKSAKKSAQVMRL